MQQPENKHGLIHNRPAALVALCLTGFSTMWSFRDVVSHAQHKSPWLLDLRFMLSPWAATAVNLAFYAYLLWLGVQFYRIAQGKERVLVAGWFIGFLLRPAQNEIPMPAAAAYVQAVGNAMAFVANGIAFVAAVHLFKIVAHTNPRLDNQASRNDR